MYELILQLVLMLSLSVVVYLMAIAVPRIEEKKANGTKNGSTNLPLEQLDNFLNSVKDKVLRRLKGSIMKADNLISKHLNNKKEGL